MPANEQLLNRVREALCELPMVTEKRMFGGTCFMVDEKMCICINAEGLLCRIGEQQAAISLEKDSCRQMMHGDRIMKDFVYVDAADLNSAKEFQYWMDLSLAYNAVAKVSKKKK